MAGTDVLDGLLDDFVDWLNATYDPATEPDIDADVVDALLTTRRDYAGMSDAEQWHPGDLTELLLEVAPRQVTFHRATIDRTAPSLAAYLRFLGAEHRLQPAGFLPVLLAELEAVSGEYPEAM
jgi:hypothetical protein